MITELPADMPVTAPVPAITVATAVLLLLQVPPATVLLNVFAAPMHIPKVPVIGAVALTVMIFVAMQPPME